MMVRSFTFHRNPLFSTIIFSSILLFNVLSKQIANIDFPAQITNIKVLKQNDDDTETISIGDYSGKIHIVTINNTNKQVELYLFRGM